MQNWESALVVEYSDEAYSWTSYDQLPNNEQVERAMCVNESCLEISAGALMF